MPKYIDSYLTTISVATRRGLETFESSKVLEIHLNSPGISRQYSCSYIH